MNEFWKNVAASVVVTVVATKIMDYGPKILGSDKNKSKVNKLKK